MRNSNIVFGNLRAEMSRQNIGVTEMARRLKLNRDTLSRKLSGKTQINLDDAFLIQRAFFPDLGVEYLFATDDDISVGTIRADQLSAAGRRNLGME